MTNSLTASSSTTTSNNNTNTTTSGGKGAVVNRPPSTTTATMAVTSAAAVAAAAATTFMPVGEILSHKLTMFNFKLPSARTLHESSLIYCNLCDFSCDLTDKSAIIVHYLNKHPEDNIVYSYLWPQMETTGAPNGSNPYKIKYYLIKAHLKVRSKDNNTSAQSTTTTVVTTTTDLSTLNYPNTILSSEESSTSSATTEEDSEYVMGKLLDWVDAHLTTTTTTTSSGLGPAAAAAAAAAAASGEGAAGGADVQELEEEQEVQEVEMSPGEDVYDPSTALVPLLGADAEPVVGDLLKLTASTLYYSNQQKILNNTPGYTIVLDNAFLVHLLAISKIENVFRVKQIHDYYGGCFVCGQKVEFNMKHYQTHFNSEMTTFMCLHCNHKEYRQEAEKTTSTSTSSQSSSSSSSGILKSPSHNHDSTTNNADAQINPNDPHSMLSAEERLLQSHMTSQHQIDFAQIVAQHQQLSSTTSSSSGTNGGASNDGVVLIESPPMNDMYLQVTIKSLKYIDDELLKRDEFKADLFYSCPICLGDVSVHVNNAPGPLASAFAQHESVTFDYLMAHFYHYHQFKAVPLFVCSLCNCARVSLVDCVYHYVRSHFNSKPVIGICAYNISDKIAPGTGSASGTQSSSTTGSSGKKSSAGNQAHVSSTQLLTNSLAMVASTQSHVYGSGPLVHCVICAENYSNEHAFIRHSFLAHLLDPNINLNWFKVYTPSGTNQVSATHTYEQSLQYIAQAMSDETLCETLVYECPLCFKPLNSRDSIARHLIYHALSEQYEYDMQCMSCSGGKQLSAVNNLAECLLHVREFRGHRVQIGFHKFVLNGSAESGEPVKPMCSCVLCGYEQSSIFASIHHVMVDHFGYDSSTVRMKRFVNALLGQTGPLSVTASSESSAALASTVSPVSTTRIKLNSLKAGLPSSATSTPSKPATSAAAATTPKQDTSQFNAELVAYFGQHFPALINELLVALMSAATNQQSNASASSNSLTGNKIGGQNHNATSATTTNRSPDTFLQDIRCFKCGKFATKLKNSLFRHLHDEHQFDMKEMERLYEHHIQTQLQLIDEQHLVEKYERGQREAAQQQLALFKEARVKSEQQRKEAAAAAATALQTSSIVVQIDGQPTLLQLSDAAIQPQANTTAANVAATASLTDNTTELIVPVSQQTATTLATTTVSQPQQTATSSAATTTTPSTHSPQTVPKASKSKHNQHHHQHHQQQQQQDQSSNNKIDSVIDQVLSQYCKEDYNASVGDVSPNKLPANYNTQQQQQTITVTAQPPEAENLFVFKCNLCESFSTDDATALLDHYKLTHSVELTIADSSTLLAAAVAAFQTGHTIEMTGAILNTLSSVTDESGLTIISGEEVPVHTTVQYKCTLCQAIFYEKQYIVQHLYDSHNFEIDVAYFEEIEQQQQEQLQQKILEQNQEQQLIMQQQQQQQQQQGAVQVAGSADHLQHIQADSILLEPEQQQVPAQVQVVAQQQRSDGSISDETAAVMMVMMNGGTLTATPLQPNQIITDASGNATAQLVITQNGDAQLVTAGGATALLQSHQDIQSLIPTATTAASAAKPAINYSCTYCNFGSDKLKKMSDHLKQMHANREKTCMDNTRQQLIRLPNEDLPPYNQPPTTVGALLNLHQQQQLQLQQQQLHQKTQPRYQQQTTMDTLSSSLLNLTNSAASNLQQQQTAPQASSSVTDTLSQQQHQQQQQQAAAKSTPGRKRGPKAKQTVSGGGRTPTVASTLSKQLQQQQQQQMLRAPTILTMDANSQIIIDFNQNDDLLCGYCDYTMNNLNYMRTHIKYKHKSLPITFQNKITSKYYTIVEWPLTPVPTLTPAPNQPAAQAAQTATSAPLGSTQQQASQNETSNQQQTASSTAAATESTSTTVAASTGEQMSPSIKSSASKENLASSKSGANAAADSSGDSKAGFTQAGGININTNNVNSILKKLGVNIGQTGGQTALSSLISGIGSGTKSVNNSIVNVNLNSLKDVNLDEMIDDDDDEERKFLIRELEKKAAANAKKGLNTSGTGYNSDTGSTCGGSGAVRVKRSRSNSSTGGGQLDTSQGGGESSPAASTTTTPQTTSTTTTQQVAQLNITLNCHYCWAQFQLNVTKNLKNSVQQKENGKYMQHLALHLNAPYKCNECSYPITDTKTFFKHKQFYKHDEKTCIMVDNDLTLPASTTSTQQSSVVRRKTLISTRLRQYIQQAVSSHNHHDSKTIQTATGNEMELENENDSFKCLLCYPDGESAPSTSTSMLNKRPTSSAHGASNFSFDKEQVLKHVLIVHLSFLAYKCDTCVQFYAFDEPQTKQHAALVHQNNEVPCQFKLIKTEEEINLAINRAQQFIAKIAATSGGGSSTVSSRKRESSNTDTSSEPSSKRHQAAASTTTPIDAVPKYKCCKCSPLQQLQQQQQQAQSTDETASTTTNNESQTQQNRPIVLYTYQEALDHVMSTHMSSQLRQQQHQAKGSSTPVSTQKQALNYELELFEQQMEDLISSETGVVTTVAASKAALSAADEESEESDDEDLGEWASDYEERNAVDYSEWSFALSEPLHLVQGSVAAAPVGNATLSPNQQGHRRKRFKTNANTSLSDLTVSTTTSNPSTTLMTRPGQHYRPKRFFYKPYILIECSICSRRMTELDVDHWLEHESESHKKLFGVSSDKFVYQQVRSGTNNGQTTQPASDGSTQSSSHVNSKSYESFTQFWADYSVTEKDITVKPQSDTPQKLQNCLICGVELKHLYADIIGHYANEHGLAHLTSVFKLWQLECLNALQSNNLCQLSVGVQIRKHPYIRLPPALVNPNAVDGASTIAITRAYLIDREIKCLNEIFKEQVVEKQIVSWLNTEQFFRRWFNYSSYVCVICSASKTSILDAHYSAKCKSDRRALETTRTHFYSDEMKTVVLTNHVLSHFNEYCYRCMSCKISWPDRTQLLKHSQECPNSQVVRTKTKYKLKANHRVQLKFYLLSLIDYWTQERDRPSPPITAASASQLIKPNAKCFLKDLKSKQLLLDVAARNGLSAIHSTDSYSIRFDDDDEN